MPYYYLDEGRTFGPYKTAANCRKDVYKALKKYDKWGKNKLNTITMGPNSNAYGSYCGRVYGITYWTGERGFYKLNRDGTLGTLTATELLKITKAENDPKNW